MVDKKKEFTQEELELIDIVHQEYIDMQTRQEPQPDIEDAVANIWKFCGVDKKPTVITCDSPISCKQQSKKDNRNDLTEYWSIWYVGYNAMYDFGQRIGLDIDKEKLKLFSDWVRCCPFVLFNEDLVYVSRKPKTLAFNDNQQLHLDNGKSCEFLDGWGIYTIDGVSVDEQIVMAPETQTLEQCRKETNEEIKRIRIGRYGWTKFLDGIGAKAIDERTNDIEGTKEFLLEAKKENMKALLCICPSTAKEFVLEVPPATKTCKEAQSWLSNGASDRIIAAS
jgi:hypothetical protein